MAYVNPSVADFKAFFNRDFPYGTDIETSVTDGDIAKSFVLVNMSPLNQGLFLDQSAFTTGYLLFSAHYLVTNLRASSQGINGQYAWLEQSKGVGGISASFMIPERVQKSPFWSQLYKTNYGAQLMQILLPQLSGAVFVTYGRTLP